MPVLCPSAFRDGRPIFYDGDHLSRSGDMFALPSFLAFLRSLS